MRQNRIFYRCGFSLVEILVGIGIIGILVTLAMSGLTTAKAKSKSTRCVANLRQLAAACHLYASDFADSMPPNSTTRHSGATEHIPSWTAGMLDYSDSNTDNTNTFLVVNGYGSIGQYTKEPQLYRCPSDRSYVTPGGRKMPRVRSYSMNAYVGDSRDTYAAGPGKRFEKYSDFAVAGGAGIWMLIEEHEDSIERNEFWRPFALPKANGWQWQSVPAAPHAESCNLAFSDASVQTKRWRDARTLIPVKRIRQKNLQPEKNVNPDVAWLEHRTSVLVPNRSKEK